MGNFIHFIVCFITGFAIAFSMLWKLGLVTLAILPAIAISGLLYTYTLTNITSKSQVAYANANYIVEQV